MNPYYKDYGEYLADIFPGEKVQKISINAGFSCPNRDGTIGRGGCIYCDNRTFTPAYCFDSGSITEQIEKGKRFFARKYPSMKYLAYFQSFTNTFNYSVGELERMYDEALGCGDVVGIIVGSRPDCFPEEVIRLLGHINRKSRVFVELGAETSHDDTLKLINRGHFWEDTVDTAYRLSSEGLEVGLHLICGLPGEDENMMLRTVRRACELPIRSLKFHHLQVIDSTPLHKKIVTGELNMKGFTPEDYLELCVKIINIVPRTIAIERFLASSPPEKVISPKWGLKNYEFTNLLLNRLKQVT